MSKKVCALVVAAGRGERMGKGTRKPFLLLNGLSILVYPLKTLCQSPLIESIVLVIGTDELDYCQTEIVQRYNLTKVVKVIPGGLERQDSVYEGLKELPTECGLVLIQDGVRPFLTSEMITQSIEAAWQYGSAIVGVPAKDTIKMVNKEALVTETLDRERLWLIQTPQVFDREIILSAYNLAYQQGFYATDDSRLVERLGKPVKLVMGAYHNLKITTPDDLFMAETIIQQKDRGGWTIKSEATP